MGWEITAFVKHPDGVRTRWGKDIRTLPVVLKRMSLALKRMFRTGDLQCHNASEDYRTGGRWWHWVYLAATFKQRENINTRAGRTHSVDVDTLLLCQLFYFRILSRAVDHESHDNNCDAILIHTLPTPETYVYFECAGFKRPSFSPQTFNSHTQRAAAIG